MPMTKELLPGTLDLFILKAKSLGPAHGYGVLLRIQDTSRGMFSLEQASPYPALNRVVERGLITADWGLSKKNRRARFHHLARAGKKRLAGETLRWPQMVRALSHVLDTQPGEV